MIMNKDYRVIKIIDDTSLIVNAGTNDGVEKGDYMQISGKGSIIVDPETNEELGRLDVIKDKLNVTKVYEKMCICETSYTSTYFSAILSNPLFTSTQKKLDVEPTDISGEGDKTIRIGDIARVIKQEKQIKQIENNHENEERKK